MGDRLFGGSFLWGFEVSVVPEGYVNGGNEESVRWLGTLSAVPRGGGWEISVTS